MPPPPPSVRTSPTVWPRASAHRRTGAENRFEVEGYVAGFGNPDWKSTHTAASRTAVAVTTLLKQGATCVGRTVMDELGFGVTGENLHCGTPINPASPSVVPGGSCSGSAVAVSAQLVDFALVLNPHTRLCTRTLYLMTARSAMAAPVGKMRKLQPLLLVS